MPIFWPESYPNLVERANLYRAAGQYLDAGVEYLKAASLAPCPRLETELLQVAFWCSERAAGRLSGLELEAE